MDFREIEFPSDYEYSSDSEYLPIQFYMDVLPKSKKIYLKLGYFSSSAIRVLAYGFSEFIYNGGEIKIITNHYLYGSDKELLNEDLTLRDEEYEKNISLLFNSLTSEGEHFFNCIKHLIKKNKIEIIPVMLRPNKMAHYKQGIFVDESENILQMDGSCNFTASGLIENGEVITVFRSWGGGYEKTKIDTKIQDLKDIVNKKNNKYEYLSSDKILDALGAIGKDLSQDELIDEEVALIDNNINKRIKIMLEKYKERLLKKIEYINSKPSFPFESEPRDYQKIAYSNWCKNNYKGIFAMATGTGKTITALNCLLNIYNDTGRYQAIIAVPGKVLLNQWIEEVYKFNFKNIVKVSSDYSWRQDLDRLNTSFLFNDEYSFIIIVTYNSLASDDFLSKIENLPKSTLFIADEAHNIARPTVKSKIHKLDFEKRLALSATPKKIYDPEGNAAIEELFCSTEPYTYSFSMDRAIKEGVLCQYRYYPHLVSLNEEEMDEYAEISKKLLKYFDFGLMKYKEYPIVTTLLLARKRIVHKAANKLNVFSNIIKDYILANGDIKYTFVYVPEGNDVNDRNLMDKYIATVEEIDKNIRCYPYVQYTKNKDEILDNFENGDYDIVFSMKCLDEGVDIPRAEMAIFCSSTGNPRQFIQRRGRVLRKHEDKDIAVIHDLVVLPKAKLNENTFNMEKNLIFGELTRVVYFASLAINYYDAMEVFSDVARHYDLDMYAIQSELGDTQ